MTPPCDGCDQQANVHLQIGVSRGGRGDESPGWRSCRDDAGDGGSLVSAFLLAAVLSSIAGDPLWSLFPDFTRRAMYAIHPMVRNNWRKASETDIDS
jgi:hypothetical protein